MVSSSQSRASDNQLLYPEELFDNSYEMCLRNFHGRLWRQQSIYSLSPVPTGQRLPHRALVPPPSCPVLLLPALSPTLQSCTRVSAKKAPMDVPMRRLTKAPKQEMRGLGGRGGTTQGHLREIS